MDEIEDVRHLVVLVGPPGCGKSTLAADLAAKNGYLIVSSDEIRKRLYGDESEQGDPATVFAMAFNELRDTLRYGSAIFDATSCRREYRTRILDEVEGYCDKTYCIWFDTKLIDCLRQNEARGRYVPESAIASMWLSLMRNPPTTDEGWDYVLTATNRYALDFRKENANDSVPA